MRYVFIPNKKLWKWFFTKYIFVLRWENKYLKRIWTARLAHTIFCAAEDPSAWFENGWSWCLACPTSKHNLPTSKHNQLSFYLTYPTSKHNLPTSKHNQLSFYLTCPTSKHNLPTSKLNQLSFYLTCPTSKHNLPTSKLNLVYLWAKLTLQKRWTPPPLS